jgi:hypothetical protein
MIRRRATALAAFLLSSAIAALGAEPSLTLNYRAFDASGKAMSGSSLVLIGESRETVGLYTKDGGETQRIILTRYSDSLRASFSGPGEGKAFSATFKLEEGTVIVQSENAPRDAWKPGLRDGDSSLFFLIPMILDLRRGPILRTLTIVRTADGQRASFKLECLGLRRIEVGGASVEVYEVRMEPGDFLLRVIWPYANHYYFRASDLVMVRFEGPDAQRRMGRLDLSVEGSPRSGGRG